MAIKAVEGGIPWCAVFLVSMVLFFHLLTLMGNYSMAKAIGSIGTSTNGWSNVGLGLSDSMHMELDFIMSNISMVLTNAIMGLSLLENTIDQALASIGDASSNSLMEVEWIAATNHSAATLSLAAMASATSLQGLPPAVASLIPQVVEQVTDGLNDMVDQLEPPLLKIGEWVTSFGDKLQAKMEQFSTTIDLVQNMFDQIMTQVSGAGGNDEYMEHNTYTLFAMSRKDEGITVQDLKDLSQIYNVVALQGSKAEELHAKYDDNQDALIDREEYKDFVVDVSLNGLMGVVLRAYAKRLSEVSGIVSQAKMRDEVANAVVHYLQLVAAKNITKVGWISDRLTNASVPLAFTACIIKNLAQAADDPAVLTTTDVGALVLKTMHTLNPSYTQEALDLLADAEFWASEGFDPLDQPPIVEKTSGWQAYFLLQIGAFEQVSELYQHLGGPGLQWKHLSLLQEVPGHADSMASQQRLAVGSDFTSLRVQESSQQAKLKADIAANISMFARAKAMKSRRHFQAAEHDRLLERYHRLKGTDGARHMFQSLLGGRFAWQQDPVANSSVNKGQPAVPETLEFASFLSHNATDCAQEFQTASFNYTGQSSSTMDNFATQIQGMVKKTQSFISMLGTYSGQKGVDLLRGKVSDFASKAESELVGAVGGFYAKHSLQHDSFSGAVVLRQDPVDPDKAAAALGDNWEQIVTALDELKALLPPTVENLKVARTEVSEVSSTLDSIFDVFKKSGPPIFWELAGYYRYIWTFYFVALASVTLLILYYGLWASGVLEPKAEEAPEGTASSADEPPPPPKTFMEKWCCCCTCWERCFTCCENDCCFWSLLFSLQVLLLVLFLISITFCLLAGVQMFIASGCEAIYLLGDNPICTETLNIIQVFLKTFNAGVRGLDPAVQTLDHVCMQHELMLCATLGVRMKNAAIYTVVGSFMAVFFSFQLVVEVCVLHERRWWLKHFKEEAEAAKKV